MNRKDILELKRRFKKEECTFTKLCGCYVNGEKKILLEFRETFLNLPDEVFFKYLEIAKKVLSGGIGNNLLELNFPLDENFENPKQNYLMRLKKSGLKDDGLLKELYEDIIANYEISGNYLILLYHDAYDVMVKTSDNIKLDESEEVYEYVLCALCPVSLSKPGLGYFDDEKKIKARIRDWIVNPPKHGFVFPGFIDRSSDVNTVMYYTKNPKEPNPMLMEETLGCKRKQTATIQKETFQNLIKNSVGTDEGLSEKVFLDIQENLNSMVEEHNEIYNTTEVEPISLTKEKVKTLLEKSGIPEEISEEVKASFEKTFGEEAPFAEHLIDTKLIQANAHKKKEEQLLKQVENLEETLQKLNLPADDSEDLETSDTQSTDDDYAVVLHVKPDKLNSIKTELINGQRCIVVPINDNEHATVNGRKDFI